jgi:uncharacterized membrane protein YeaQ/YmgE (transglycosylase-associated protein family)
MSIVAWLLVGFVAGALAGMATGSRDRGCMGTIAIGIIGALLGGWLFRVGTGDDTAVSGFNIWSVFVAFIGAVVLLFILQMLGVDDRRRRR